MHRPWHHRSADYRFRHAFWAALASAIANPVSLLALASGIGSFLITLMIFAGVGAVGLALVGVPMARWLASRGRDTIAASLGYGALSGASFGVAAGFGVLTLEPTGKARVPDGIELVFAAPLGALVGSVSGAIAGVALLKLGRREGQRKAAVAGAAR